MEKGKVNRRQFLQMAAGASGVALLAACAPKPAPRPAEPTKGPVAEATKVPEAKPADEGPIRITYIQRSTEDEMKRAEELSTLFNKNFPQYNVSNLFVSFAESEAKLMSMYAAGIPPDIYGVTGTNPYVERILRGMVLSAQPFIDREGPETFKDAWPVVLNVFKLNGEVWAIPPCLHPAGVWINATLFDEAGVAYPPVDWKDKSWTWEAMIETARKLTLDKNEDGKIDQVGLAMDHSSPWFLTRLWGKDVAAQEAYDTGILRKLETDKAEVYDACLKSMEARQDLIWKHHVSPQPQESGALSAMGPMLKTGVLAMQFSGPWAIWGELPAQYKFRGAAHPWGGVNGNGTQVRQCWPEAWEISSKTASPEAAWAYTRWVCFDPEAIAISMKWTNTLPPTRSGFELWMKQYGERLAMTPEEQQTMFCGSLEQAETGVADHIFAGWAMVRDLRGPEFQPAWENTKTMKECLDSFIPKANQALADYLREMGI